MGGFISETMLMEALRTALPKVYQAGVEHGALPTLDMNR
jgi:hypothetical protein